MFASIILVAVILLCTFLILYIAPSSSVTSEPLLLTPYIQQGNIVTARQLSLVDDSDGIIPTSYAGFITVDPVVGNHLFFWFFPVMNYNPKAPLLIWLNGGPGESSMIGLLLENGPLQFGKSESGVTIYKRRHNTWANKFSMLYIDNPVGAGYSYSENITVGERSTQDGYTRDLYEFIQQFYQMFPEYLQRDLYIGGQSYAGKYVPAFAYKVHQDIKTGGFQVPLKGIYLGGPLLDAKVQLIQLFDLYYILGYITNAELIEFKKNLTETLPHSESQQFLYGTRHLFYPNSSDNFYTYMKRFDDEIKTVMTSNILRTLLHVGKLSFAATNEDLYDSVMRHDWFVSSASKLLELMDNYKVLIYTGDLDGIIVAPGIETVLHSLPWSSQSAYNSSRRVAWTDENGTLKGFFTRVSTFCRVVVRRAGHRTAFDQPDTTLEMMDQFVTNGCLS